MKTRIEFTIEELRIIAKCIVWIPEAKNILVKIMKNIEELEEYEHLKSE